MSGYILSELALRDLTEIDDYVAAENRAAADRLLESFEAALGLLADNPAAGRRRDELRPGIRSLPVGAYIVFYRQADEGIQILRILHGRRDTGRAFETGR